MFTPDTLKSFDTWSSVRHYAQVATMSLFYKAPMDARARRVLVVKVFKNGKIRIDPLSNDADRFTADRIHLDRFYR